MCYNCGCGQPNNDMGDSRNITQSDIEAAAKLNGTSLEQALENIEGLARKVRTAPEMRSDKDWKP